MDDLLQPKRQSKLLGTEQQMGLIRKPSLVGNTGTSGGYLSRKDSRELILLREFYTRQMAWEKPSNHKLDIGFIHASPLIYNASFKKKTTEWSIP